MHFFVEWGQRIAGGDLLEPEPLHPLHGWHQQVAAAYLDAHPDSLSRVPVAPLPEVLGGFETRTLRPETRTWLGRYISLWNRWYGGAVFHQEPLYPYLLGGIFALFGTQLWAVIVLQFAAGLWTILLLYAIAERCFDRRTAIVTAGLATLSAPLLYYEVVLLRETLITTATVLLVWCALRASARPSARRWFGLGVAAGLAVLLKATFLPYLPLLAAWRFWRTPWRRELLRPFAAAAAGMLGAFAPVIARNVAVGVSPLSLSSIGPVTFAVGNVAGYSPGMGWLPEPESLAAILHQGSGMLAVVRATIATHGNLLGWLDLVLHKLLLVASAVEIPNNTSFPYDRELWTTLSLLPVDPARALPLAAVGLALSAFRRRLPAAYAGMLLVTLLPLAFFYVSSRFLLPWFALLLPLAAHGLLELVAAARRRRVATVGLMLALVVGVAFFSRRDIQPRIPFTPGGEYRWDVEKHWVPAALSALEAGKVGRAERLLDRARRQAPAGTGELSAASPPADPDQVDAAAALAQVFRSQERIEDARGRPAPAQERAAAARRLEEAVEAVEAVRRRPAP
jgi:4-amino-4-deoxy-L-arabinose transferase-like glycosyltransferase